MLGLLRQEVDVYFAILGHENTSIGEVLRIYSEAQVTRVIHCRNEVAIAHAATPFAMLNKKTPAVLTSIGPGALQAFAGTSVADLNGIGVLQIYGDETTHGEGPNM